MVVAASTCSQRLTTTRRRRRPLDAGVAGAPWQRTARRRHLADGPPRVGRARAARRGPGVDEPVAVVGPVPVGPAVGLRAGGLLRRRRRVGLLPLRPVARAGLPVGRGRAGRDLRPVRFPQRLGRAVERQGPGAQGAAVRADERRGQPRRGRQGVLVGPRRHADALVDALALPLPAGRVPVRAAAAGQRGPHAGRARVRARRHRRPRRRPFLRRHRHLRQGRTGRPHHRDRGDQPRPGSRAAAPAAAGLVPQHLGVGPRRPPGHAAPPRRPGADDRQPARGRVRSRLPRPLCPCRRRRPRRACSARTRRTPWRCSGQQPTRRPTPRTASTAASCTEMRRP